MDTSPISFCQKTKKFYTECNNSKAFNIIPLCDLGDDIRAVINNHKGVLISGCDNNISNLPTAYSLNKLNEVIVFGETIWSDNELKRPILNRDTFIYYENDILLLTSIQA